MYDVSSYYRELLVINSLYHTPASERPYEIAPATTLACVPVSFGPAYSGVHTEHVHDIAPDPAFLPSRGLNQMTEGRAHENCRQTKDGGSDCQ